MAENYVISITTEAAQALRAKDEIIAGLRTATAEAFRTGKAIGEQLGAGAREAARSAKAAQQEIDRGWKEVARTATQAARTEAAAQKQASRETAAAARQAAREQEEYAKHVTLTVERAARERIAAEKAAYRETAKAARDAAQAQERSAREAQSAQRSARPSAGGGAGSQVLGGLGIPLGAAAGVGTAIVAAKGFIELSDSYANLTSRLITLTGSEAAALPLREKLLKVAQDTKSANSSVVELYARIAGAVKELGVSEQQTLDFTERLTKSFKISGASTMAQEQAMIQLAQGLGAGALRGEEFNSVLEAAPNIIDIVGLHIRKTRGEMRAMAEQGRLTTKTIIDAFEAAGPSIDEKFGKRIVTVGEQWVGFKNQMEVAVGEIGRSVNVSGLASEAFRSLGGAVKELAGLASGAIDLWKQWNDATGGLQGKILKLSMSLENSPLFKYLDGVKTLANYMGLGATLGTVTYTRALEAHNAIVIAGTAAIVAENEAIRQRTRDLKDGIGVLDEFGRATKRGDTGLETMDAELEYRDKRNAARRRQRILDGKAFTEPRYLPGGLTIPADNPNAIERLEASDAARDRLIQSQEKARTAGKALRESYAQLAMSVGASAAAEGELAKIRETLDRATSAGLVTEGRANQIYDIRRERLAAQLEPYKAAIDKIREETDALGQSAEEHKHNASVIAIVNDLRAKGVELTAIERSQLESAITVQERMAKGYAAQAAVLSSIRGPQEQYAVQMRATNELAAAGTISLDEYVAKISELNPALVALGQGVVASLSEGVDLIASAADSTAAAIEKTKEATVTFGDVLTEQFASVAVSGIDALVDSLNGGAQSFSDFARSALADLEKLLIKFLVFQAIKATLGTADGSFGGILSKSLGFAAGGSFTVPGAGSGGTDSVPVYFRATPGERVTVATPGQQAAQQGGSGPPVVNVRPIIVNDQQAAMSEYLRTSDGERAIIAAVAKNPGLLRQAMAR